MECDGSCEEHKGQIAVVHVIGPNGYDWGLFNYCEAAIEEDTNRGMIVTFVRFVEEEK